MDLATQAYLEHWFTMFLGRNEQSKVLGVSSCLGTLCVHSWSVQLLDFSGVTSGKSGADSQSVQLLGSPLASCANMSKPNRVLLGLARNTAGLQCLSQP